MKNESSISDPLIRSVLHSRYLRRTKARPDTLVIDELGLAHSKGRIDVAVIMGTYMATRSRAQRINSKGWIHKSKYTRRHSRS